MPSGHAISVSILLLFCTIKTMEKKKDRWDVTWRDVTWCDVTWCDEKMGCSVTWCDGMGCSVTWCDEWYHEIGPISFRFYDSVVLNCPGMFVLHYRNICVWGCVCGGQPEGFRSEINVSTIRSWWGSSFPSSSFRLYHSIVLNSAQMSVLRAETSKIRGQKRSKKWLYG